MRKWLLIGAGAFLALAFGVAYWISANAPAFKVPDQPARRPDNMPVIDLSSPLPPAPEADGSFTNKLGQLEPCLTQAQLKEYAGAWLLKRDVDGLARSREWLGRLHIVVSPDGSSGVAENWHDGPEARCLSAEGGQLFEHGRPGARQVTSGPYIRVMPDYRMPLGAFVFEQIFRSECFRDEEEGETWCLGNGQLVINGQGQQATLQLDTAGLPRYGLAVTPSVWDANKMLFFVQTPEGWDVYEDEALGADREPTGPGVSEPDRSLKRPVPRQ